VRTIARAKTSSKSLPVFVGLDTMSTECFVRAEVVQQLRIKCDIIPGGFVCRGLGHKASVIKHSAKFTLGDDRYTLIEAYVLPTICESVPYMCVGGETSSNKRSSKPPVKLVNLDVLLSADMTWRVIKCLRREEKEGEVSTVIETKYGPCAVGRVEGTSLTVTTTPHFAPVALLSNKDLDRACNRYFSLELIGIRAHEDDERRAEENEAQRQLREKAYVKDGVWVTPILFKPDAKKLRNNYTMALKRFHSMERKLKMDPQLEKDYDVEIKALFERGDARWLREDEIDEPIAFYMPHRPVVRPDKETTKIRPVFDASAKTRDGISLNSEILKTPVLHPALTGILMRFRMKPIGLTGDISKMFLRMGILPEHEKFQRFLARPEPGGPIKHAAITKVAFGVADSPYRAMESVKRTIEEYKDEFPEAAEELSANLYVDDLLTGAETTTAAVKLQKDCVTLLDKAGLPMRKWCSNSPEVLEQIPEGERGETSHLLLTSNIQSDVEAETPENVSSSVLGVQWDVKKDELHFVGHTSIPLPAAPCTKRELVSAAFKFYDPMGYLAPFLVRSKVLVQRLQVGDYDWNRLIPEDLGHEWNRWISEVPSLGDIILRRCLRLIGPKVEQKMLVVFGDASDLALGMAIYMRISYDDGQCESHLVMAKSKVAPKNVATLPRKELAAALAATRLLVHVAEALQMDPKEARCFTDSMTTLQWLRKHPRTWKQWVANRVTVIHELTGPEQWRHVAGPENPADLPSRGITAAELAGNTFWYHGPKWLLLPEAQWPRTCPQYTADYLEEQKGTLLEDPAVALVVSQPSWSPLDDLWKKSSWATVINVTMLVLSWRPARTDEQLQQHEERLRAIDWWIQREQEHCFAEERRLLAAGRPIQKNSRLVQLDPILRNGLLRVGGRLPAHPFLTEDERHPVILPRTQPRKKVEIHSSVTARIIEQAHRQHLHAGAEWLLRHLRARYWIMAGRATVRAVIGKCVECQVATKPLVQQKMAPLPTARLGERLPWVDVGVDFAGPFGVKPPESKKKKAAAPAEPEKRGRGRPRIKPLPTPTEKAYVLIFTDLTTRGVHFEVTRGMDVETFFRAFSRFSARRGLPLRVYSDEATNFVRAKTELLHLAKAMKAKEGELERRLDQLGVEWKLNTPHAPFRGGAWERLLRSFKETLRRTVQGQVLSEEELRTVAVQIEGMMNDRPLYHNSADPEDLPITPSMLMHGRQLGQLPAEAEADDAQPTDEKMTSLWKRRRALFDAAWRTFFAVYVRETLPKFKKWTEEGKDELKVGQIVLLSTEKPARGHWPRARVTGIKEAGRSRDGITRTVTVKLADGTEYSRPVQQLVRLELDYPDQDGVEAEAPLPGPSVHHLGAPDDSRSDDDAEEGGLSIQSDPVRNDPLQASESGVGQQGEENPPSSGPRDQTTGEDEKRVRYNLRSRAKATRGRSN
jgi:hypothetical protein